MLFSTYRNCDLLDAHDPDRLRIHCCWCGVDGWVTFSKTGQSVYYRGRTLLKANGISGNFCDVENGEEYWVSGVKKRGSNVHWAESVTVLIDDDAREEYRKLRSA